MSQASFYDRTAPRYDALLAAPIDRWMRRAFQSLVRETAPAGSLLLDFGCGTGLDALWYARQGYRVLAYDISAGMLEQLRRRCGAEIARGEVVPVEALSGLPRPDAVVSNYGVLNALGRPRAFFEAVAPLLEPGAPLVISVLNPFFWKDMLHRWWWAALARSLRHHAIVTRGEGIETHRHFLGSLVAAARPAFRLRGRASVGALLRRGSNQLDWEAPRTLAERLEARLWKTLPLRSAGLFVFLTFRRV